MHEHLLNTPQCEEMSAGAEMVHGMRVECDYVPISELHLMTSAIPIETGP